MLRSSLTALAVILLVAGANTMAGDDSPGAGQPKVDLPSGYTEIKGTVENLSHHIDLWHDAILKGNREKAGHYEREIQRILRSDIRETRKAVRYYARRAAAESSLEDDQEQVSGDGQETAVEFALRRSVSLLSSKTQLSRSFDRTDAFSNKYRLVNDYVGLLRKQLEMPQPKLAGEKVTSQSYPVSRVRQ
jgi:hypothetical protein